MRTRNIPVTAVTFALASVLPPAGVMAQDVIPRSLGATTQALVDTFDKPGDWGLPDGHGSTRDTGGAIQMDLDSEGWMWGSRDLSATHHPVVRIAGTVAVDGTGASGGWMCGTPGSAYGFGVVDGAGAWQIGHVIDGEVTVIADGLLPESARAGGSGETLVDVQCGQVNVDVTQVLLSIDGVPVGTANVPPIGPFGRVAFVGTSTTSEPATITFDDLAVWTGPRYASSDEPGPTVGPVATPRSVDTLLGADTVVFRDDFTTPDLWGVGAGKDAFVTYQDGQLAITVLTPDASRWSWRSVAGNHPVMRVEGPVTPGPAPDPLAGCAVTTEPRRTSCTALCRRTADGSPGTSSKGSFVSRRRALCQATTVPRARVGISSWNAARGTARRRDWRCGSTASRSPT